MLFLGIGLTVFDQLDKICVSGSKLIYHRRSPTCETKYSPGTVNNKIYLSLLSPGIELLLRSDNDV